MINIDKGTHRIGIGAIILNEKSEVLLVLRRKNPQANKWSIPGGKVENHETTEQAVLREVKEEVNLTVEIDRLISNTHTISNDKSEHWVSYVYLVRTFGKKPINLEPQSFSDMKWFSFNDLPENVADFCKEALDKMKKELDS